MATAADHSREPVDPVRGEPRVRSWRLDLAYEGTAFHGWACQPGLRTVQGVLEEALAVVLRERVRVAVAGRTDAGVHAWGQVASFSTRGEIDGRRLLRSLDALLPEDVAVRAVSPAPEGFQARAARSRTYCYRLWVAPGRPACERQYVWRVRGALDATALSACAELFVGRRDFAACTPSVDLYHTCRREVRSAVWVPRAASDVYVEPRRRARDEEPGGRAGHEGPGGRAGHEGPESGSGQEELQFWITADGFLHNMVRVIVGTSVDVAQGRLSLAEVVEALSAGERRRMGQTAPARGLALMHVEY